MFYNTFESFYSLNSLLDGDLTINVKNKIDFGKREKKRGSSGATLRNGTHKVMYLNTITEYINENYKMYGPYRSINEILNDARIKDESIRQYLIDDFRNSVQSGKLGSNFRPTFDGQSISTPYHVLDMLDKFGRVENKAKGLMIAKNYRPLTNEEIQYLNKFQITFNSKKTVTASKHFYLKLSEMTLDRYDVSILFNPHTNKIALQEEKEAL